MLLKCGAQVDVFDFSRNTPLHTLVSTVITLKSFLLSEPLFLCIYFIFTASNRPISRSGTRSKRRGNRQIILRARDAL